MIILAILLIIFGLFMLVYPATIWKITESWKSSDATEPSDLYLLSTRFGGTMCILVGFGGIIVYLLI